MTLLVPEGQQQLLFLLRAPDVLTNAVVTVHAVLVNGTGTATHTEHQEATVSLVSTAINYDDGRPVVDISSFVPGVGTWTPELDHDHNYIYHAPEGGFLTLALLSGHDQIYGNSSVDFITAGNGHDRLYGGGGNDTLLGGNYFLNQQVSLPLEEADGNDLLDGQAGDDTVEGDGGHDRVYGGVGNDRLFGDAGDYGSYFSPPGGDDLLDGGADNDVLWGDYGADILLGGTGDDVLVGDYLAHVRKPGTGDPYFLFDRTRAKDDVLDGGADSLFGDGGNDTLLGGAGNDVSYGNSFERSAA